MGLQTYRQKRRFDVTAEPRGRKSRKKGSLYVIQKHAARRLHYDFRLEHDGVLMSWAVTRGPSLVPGEKRLAVHVEDHPLDYGAFEGTIPKGQYGGGTVMLWDRGTWTPEGDPDEGLKKGHLVFDLDGEKLKGRWHLVRMRARPNEKHDNWLLIKGDDEEARAAKDPDILEEETQSVATRRSMDEIAAGKKPKVRTTVKAAAVWNSVARSERATAPPPTRAKAAVAPAVARPRGAGKTSARAKVVAGRTAGRAGSARLPDFVPPCLARLETRAPDSGGWVHEIKLDGYRVQAWLDDGKVRLLTRKGLDWARKFKPIAESIARLAADEALIDGEIVVESEAGVSDFSALQADLSAGRSDRFVYVVFDLLHLNGVDWSKRPLIERKAALQDLLAGATGRLRYSEHLDDAGAVVLQHACRMRLEGIISKRSDAPYRSGRTGDWIKTKCANRQEFVIVGFSPSTAHPRAVGALAMGYYEGGRLRYAGRVGTGFSQRSAGELYRALDKRRIDKPAVVTLPVEERRRKDMRWVAPEVVAEVEFGSWTADRILRHAAFKGVREDKNAHDVVCENLREDVAVVSRSRKGTGTRAARAVARKVAKAAAQAAGHATPRVASAAPRKRPTVHTSSISSSTRSSAEVAGVTLSNPDRVYWDDVGVTKKGLAEFYEGIWDWIAPHIVRRPLALLRCPDGTGADCFMQKHAHATFDRKRILRFDDDGEEILAIDDLAGLIALVQAGVLEVHVWGTTIDHIDRCDRLVFDLDPGPGVGWPAVIAAAREVRTRLDDLGLESFIKTSGGKGLHIVSPIAPAPWDAAKDFCHAVALEMAADAPDKFVAKMTKSLRAGRIFVDYLRNGRGATAVAAYSSRARPGAPASTPIAWSELTPALTADKYTVLNLGQRLARLRNDPWAGIGTIKQKLPTLRRRGKG